MIEDRNAAASVYRMRYRRFQKVGLRGQNGAARLYHVKSCVGHAPRQRAAASIFGPLYIALKLSTEYFSLSRLILLQTRVTAVLPQTGQPRMTHDGLSMKGLNFGKIIQNKFRALRIYRSCSMKVSFHNPYLFASGPICAFAHNW